MVEKVVFATPIRISRISSRVSFQELQVGFMSSLLYEADWWYPVSRPTRSRNLAQAQTNLSTEKARPWFEEHILVVYCKRQEGTIDRAFFSSVVEFWMNTVREIGRPYQEVRLGDIRGLGFHVFKAATILSASHYSHGCCHLALLFHI